MATKNEKARPLNVTLFSELMQHHKKPLFTYVLSRTRNRQIAEDIFQEVGIKILLYRKPEGILNLKSVCFTLARHIIIDRYRRRQTEKEYVPFSYNSLAKIAMEDGGQSFNGDADLVNVYADALMLTAQEPTDVNDPYVLLKNAEALENVLRALPDIDTTKKAIFMYHRLCGYPQKQIADMFDMTVSNVEKHVSSVSKKLKQLED